MKRVFVFFVIFCMLFSFASFVKAQNENVKVKVTTDKAYYLVGEPIKITYTVTNDSDSPARFTFNTAQIYDFSIVNYGRGRVVYRWSLGKKFAQVITHLEIPAHSSKSFTAVWDQKSNTGNAVTVGSYRVSFWLVSGTPFGKTKESAYLASTTFGISGNVNIPFKDIADPYVQNSVRLLYRKGLIKGYPDGTFKPDRHLTRAEGTVLILRIMGITPSGNYKQDFSDVPTNFWGFKWIEEAYKRNIIKGTGNEKFSPNAEMIRGEFVVMLMRALKIPFVNKKNPFADLKSSYFGYKEIITAYYYGVAFGIQSSGKIYFKPFNVLTRGEAANFMARAVSAKPQSLKYSIKESIKEKPFEAVSEAPVLYTPKVPSYQIKDIKNLSQYKLTDIEQKALKDKGFFIKKSNYDTFSDFYGKNGGRPVFVSFDTFLQAYHIIFDMSLRYDEIQYFAGDLDKLSKLMIINSIAQYYNAPQELKEAAKRNITFFYIGEKLLNPDYELPLTLNPNTKKEICDTADKEFALINEHKGIAVSPLFDYKEDYSQYVPRGHYTRNETFKHYFKSMMWYGRIRFLLKPGISKKAIQMGRSQTQSAILITLVLANDPNLAALYDKIYEPTVFFVGKSDDINFYNYVPIVKTIYGGTVSLDDLTDAKKLDSFINKVLALPNPKISTTGGTEVNEEKGFRFMGQRFTLDAYILQNLVYPKAGYRMLPKAMDIFNVFGNKEAENIMLNVYNEKKNSAYVNQVKVLRKEISNFTKKDWLQNLYWGWLSLLKTYAKGKRGNGYPFFMQNGNWARKELFTALASYTELKHDTILYAKQSYTLMAAPPLVQPGYVEPNIEGYEQLLRVLNITEKGLSDRGLLPDVLKIKIESLKGLTKGAIKISKKELENTPLDKNDKMYFSGFSDEIKALMTFPKDFSSEVMGAGDGKTALVADIHTDPNSGTVLEEGVGNVFEIYVAARYNNKIYLFRGPVFSYYEFTEKMSNRLTDEEWQSMIKEGNTPEVPKWAKPLVP